MNVQTTLNFYGRTEEAIKFYANAIEAEILFMLRFRERPDRAQLKPGTEEKIFHATFRIGETQLMASDCGCENSGAEPFGGFSLAIRVETPEKAEQFFIALSRAAASSFRWRKHFLPRDMESSRIDSAFPGRSSPSRKRQPPRQTRPDRDLSILV